MKNYQIQLNEHQAYILRNALHVLARLKSGQINIAIEEALPDKMWSCEINNAEVRELCDQLKEKLYPELDKNASYGVGSKHDAEMSVAWDMMQVVRHKLAWDKLETEGKKPEFYGVQYNEPMKFAEEPLIEIKSSS